VLSVIAGRRGGQLGEHGGLPLERLLVAWEESDATNVGSQRAFRTASGKVPPLKCCLRGLTPGLDLADLAS